ncbi:hypothetical protein ACLOJK_011668 [Asimina triloba]
MVSKDKIRGDIRLRNRVKERGAEFPRLPRSPNFFPDVLYTLLHSRFIPRLIRPPDLDPDPDPPHGKNGIG